MIRPDPADHYAALGVADSAPHAAIRAAYRRIVRDTHPDVAGDDPAAVARAVRVIEAWSVLRDPTRRARYDRERMAARRRPVPGVPSWGPGGIRPVTPDQLREAAAREAAYSAIGRAQREAFSAATWRIGLAVVLIGSLLLALVVAR